MAECEPLTVEVGEQREQRRERTRQSDATVPIWHDYSPISFTGPIYTKVEMSLMLVAIFTNFAFLIQLYGALPAKSSYYSNLYLFDLILLFAAYIGPTTSLPGLMILPNALIKGIVALALFALATLSRLNVNYRDPILTPSKNYFNERPNMLYVCYLFALLFMIESAFCLKRYKMLRAALLSRTRLLSSLDPFLSPSPFLLQSPLHSFADIRQAHHNQKPPPSYHECTSPNALPSYEEVSKQLRPQRPLHRYLTAIEHIL